LAGSREFVREFEKFLDRYLNIVYDDESLDDRPDLALGVIVEMARRPEPENRSDAVDAARLERRLFDAVGTDRHEEALNVLRIGRLSWQLRDDDNILMGRLENQLQRAMTLAAGRLVTAGRLDADARFGPGAAELLAASLRAPQGGPIQLPPPGKDPGTGTVRHVDTVPRQMIGQPASPGLATGVARIVRDAEDFSSFRSGEVMVCDAIQPTMTHLVPLAAAIVERRGGMLIHGAIIARELGVPCVNGVANAAGLLRNGDLVTVDGYLGIVTVGPPEFDLEQRQEPGGDSRA
jgi:pyruvate,water dikinase